MIVSSPPMDAQVKTDVQRRRWQRVLPQLLLGILILVAIGTVFNQAKQYGIASDESLQNQYGQYALAWYKSLGNDKQMFHYPEVMHMPEHGVIFEVAVAIAQKVTGEQWYTRAVMCGLAGVAGIIAIALCGLELEGWWLAFVAALSLWLFPRFYGSIYNNSKDIPIASACLFVLWGILLFMRQWDQRDKFVRNTILVGFLIGLAASIRITAVLWYAVLLCLFALRWVQHGRQAIRSQTVIATLIKQIAALVIVGSVSFVTMIFLWPYIAVNPLHNLYAAIVTMSKYPWIGIVWFAGRRYLSNDLPPTYIPGWLLVSSPLPVLLSAVLGIVAACVLVISRRNVMLPVVSVILASFVPMIALIVAHVTLYNGPRQFLFLYGPFVLLAAYGFVQVLSWLNKHKTIVIAIILIALLAQAQVEWDIASIHPYEYIYFNQIVGGVPGATGKWDMDYYITCNKAAAGWLATHYRQYTRSSHLTVQVAMDPYTALPYLPPSFALDAHHPDFFIATTYGQQDHAFASYQIINTQTVEGYTACVVKVNPALP